MSRKHLIIAGIVIAVLAILGLAMPKIIHWFVGGAVAGGAALISVQRRRRKANTEHEQNIAAEKKEVEELQQDSEKLVDNASARADESPQDAVKNLTEDERRARLDEVARKLQ